MFVNDQWPRGAAWSACLPVTQEIVGSNPIEVAWKMARYANRQSGEAQTFVMCGFDSRLRHLNNMRRLGIGEPK